MKILFLILILLPSVAFSKSWRDIENVKNSAAYASKEICQKITGNSCDVCEDNRKCIKGMVDDINQPNLRAVEDSPVKLDCNDYQDCNDKAFDPNGDDDFSDQVCIADGGTPKWDELVNWPDITGVTGPWFIWCQKADGTYKQKAVIVEDVAGKAAAEAEDAAKAQLEVIEKAGANAIELGVKAKKVMVGMIKLKGLPKAQRKALRGDLKSIIEALDVGSIDIAIDEIKALTEDGVVVTPEAKATILKLFEDAGYDIS